jgi:hypothetical protein
MSQESISKTRSRRMLFNLSSEFTREIILSSRQGVSKGDFPPPAPLDTALRAYSGC